LNEATTAVEINASCAATNIIELKQRYSRSTKQENSSERRERAAEAETKIEVGMEVNVNVNVEAEPDTQQALVPEADLNDADAIFGPHDDIDGKIMELMNRRMELLKRNDVMKEAIHE
jgi:maltose-binding protein MalE